MRVRVLRSSKLYHVTKKKILLSFMSMERPPGQRQLPLKRQFIIFTDAKKWENTTAWQGRLSRETLGWSGGRGRGEICEQEPLL